ncbi:MAG TPA: phosphatidylglycerol lysyltransferase domain-containing protein, partial [Thermoanaerobaculia bacterium]|nr:phosphatidylglycerol lysyltransferase domain-containing protein [Thermoanaerobaculia bacterium]
MSHQELLRDLTESYLKSLFTEVCGALTSDLDSQTPFGEMGIDSFYVLKLVRRMEADFGPLPKSLLFENFRLGDLANYFVNKHEETLRTMFAGRLDGASAPVPVPAPVPAAATPVRPVEAPRPPAAAPRPASPLRIAEKEAWSHPELGPLVQSLFHQYKYEGTASRGTRKIAPNLFIGSARRGFFNYGRSRDIILVYGYSGPQDYLQTLREELFEYCESSGLQLNFFSDRPIEPIAGREFSATPFGAMQRVVNLKEFSLDGGAMRRLRYMVSKFEKAGAARTEEYRSGSNPDTDKAIAGVIDRWCAERTMVNPLVHEVKKEILAGALPSEHRLFLTWLDDVLQNVILVDAMADEINGYLMDLEFYPPDMPTGGLEFAISRMIAILAEEGREVLSLGGTYGVKIESSPIADPAIEKLLDDLREQKIFNDES